MYLKSQISESVSLPGNWICLMTSPYLRMTQEKVLQFLTSCLETRLLACQRICCDHILPKIYLMKRGYTTTGTPEPDALWRYLSNFEQQMACSTFIHPFLCIQTLRPSQYSVAVFCTILLGRGMGLFLKIICHVNYKVYKNRPVQEDAHKEQKRGKCFVNILMDQELFHGKIRE